MDMDEFIHLAVEKLGFPEKSARVATADLLLLMINHLERSEVEELLQAFPDIHELLVQARGRGISGMLRKLRLKFGPEPDLSTIMYRIDRGAESLGPFLQLFVGFLKANAGNHLAARILSQFQTLDESLD